MQVSYFVSHINRVLVQDRILYNLHNTRELMIMQMREKREGSKSDSAGNHADLEITERCRQDFGGVFDLISNKHKHNNQTRQITGKPPETKTKHNRKYRLLHIGASGVLVGVTLMFLNAWISSLTQRVGTVESSMFRVTIAQRDLRQSGGLLQVSPILVAVATFTKLNMCEPRITEPFEINSPDSFHEAASFD